MRRFLPIGDNKINIVEAAVHARTEAERIVQEIEGLRPSLLLLDSSREEWHHLGKLDPFHKAYFDTVAGPQCEPDAVWKAVKRMAPGSGIRIGLLRTEFVPPPMGKDGIKGLQKALKREGFERTGEPLRDAHNFYRHFVQRFSALWSWRAQQIDHGARVLTGLDDQAARITVIMAAPGADALIDQVVERR